MCYAEMGRSIPGNNVIWEIRMADPAVYAIQTVETFPSLAQQPHNATIIMLAQQILAATEPVLMRRSIAVTE